MPVIYYSYHFFSVSYNFILQILLFIIFFMGSFSFLSTPSAITPRHFLRRLDNKSQKKVMVLLIVFMIRLSLLSFIFHIDIFCSSFIAFSISPAPTIVLDLIFSQHLVFSNMLFFTFSVISFVQVYTTFIAAENGFSMMGSNSGYVFCFFALHSYTWQKAAIPLSPARDTKAEQTELFYFGWLQQHEKDN